MLSRAVTLKVGQPGQAIKRFCESVNRGRCFINGSVVVLAQYSVAGLSTDLHIAANS